MPLLKPWMKRALIVLTITLVFAVLATSFIEFPSRYGVTSEDKAQCHHLQSLSLSSCRSQKFSEVVNTIFYLRAEFVPTPDFCNQIREFEPTECPATDFAGCFTTIEKRADSPSTQFDRRAYYLISGSCSRVLYFSSTGVSLLNLLKTRPEAWSVEQELTGN